MAASSMGNGVTEDKPHTTMIVARSYPDKPHTTMNGTRINPGSRFDII